MRVDQFANPFTPRRPAAIRIVAACVVALVATIPMALLTAVTSSAAPV